MTMRALAMSVLVLAALSNATFMARAAQSNACKQCSDQQRACMANYSSKTCRNEYDICMKGCRAKS
jgi:DTW domain-containing protein YfiP